MTGSDTSVLSQIAALDAVSTALPAHSDHRANPVLTRNLFDFSIDALD